ncbi:hypothetical protein OCHUTO_1005 [Orientia chuto str. Dubai]|uniref:Uncharacterized protein n=1 Tax=Orientia chuto str. Dubai TaxID=1359168 RepID=A0A0F3MGW2_9RICK|nr:hypothetical protein OCHUTO_1005 [Orientia chuto str. Dubai]
MLYNKAKELEKTCKVVMKKKINPQPNKENNILLGLQALFSKKLN